MPAPTPPWPPCVLHHNPHGIGLRARSMTAANQRISAFLHAVASALQVDGLSLQAVAPATEAQRLAVAEAAVQDQAHRAVLRDPSVARPPRLVEALARFGEPMSASRWHDWGLAWTWRARQAVAPEELDALRQRMFQWALGHEGASEDGESLVSLTASWTFRLGGPGSEALAPSELTAFLSGARSTAFWTLCLPFEAWTPACQALADDLQAALGLPLPAAGWKVGRWRSPTDCVMRRLDTRRTVA